jgi:hypothetical protein
MQTRKLQIQTDPFSTHQSGFAIDRSIDQSRDAMLAFRMLPDIFASQATFSSFFKSHEIIEVTNSRGKLLP